MYIPPININYGFTTNFNAVDSPIVVDENTNPLIHDYYSYGNNGYALVARSSYRLDDSNGLLAEDNKYFYFDENMSLATGNENQPLMSNTNNSNTTFGIANNTGRLHFINPPDYETKNNYEVKVSIKNGPIKYDEFTIEINDVNETIKMNDLNVMIQAGYYDGATNYFDAKYTMWQLDQSGNLKDRLSFKGYRSGHMMYLRRDDLKQSNQDLREFIKMSTPGKGIPAEYKR